MHIVRSLLLTGLLVWVAHADSDQANRLQLADVFHLEYAGDPQISPDGTQIVYTRHFADIMTDKRHVNLWIINADGTGHRPLTTGPFSDSSPQWSPDGKELAFISNREGKPQIYRYWLSNGQMARISNLVYPPIGIRWSPDGQQISFVSLVPTEPNSFADMPKPPKGAKWAEPITYIDTLVYRFDKAGYLDRGYHHVFVMPSEGGTPRQLTSGNFDHGFSGRRPSPPEWSSDGDYLITDANRRDDHEYEPLDSEIIEIQVKDGATRALTDRRGPDRSPAISNDGKWIAYLGFDDRYQGHQTARLYVMDRHGKQRRCLSETLDRSPSSISWSGTHIYFQYDDHGQTRLARSDLDGQIENLTDHVGAGMSGRPYSGGAFTVSTNGILAFTWTRPDRPGEVAIFYDGKAETITTLNADVLDSKVLGEVEEFWYESSYDQRKIQGWIIKPPEFDPNKKYPLILEIHGGPFANYGNRFAANLQLYAAQDYVVLYTNPRGSTGYGEAFANLIHHNYPGDDYYDLMSGVQTVTGRGYIDHDNIFVTGGSGGGVLTCWLIGRTNSFRAAVSAFPVINWYSFVLTADANNFFYKYWFPGFPWDHSEHYLKRSPLSLVGNVSTPTLIITGEEDYRTPMSESEQFYQALKLRKIDAALARVPGEPHGISQRPSHQIAGVATTLKWFETHRKKQPENGQAAAAGGE